MTFDVDRAIPRHVRADDQRSTRSRLAVSVVGLSLAVAVGVPAVGQAQTEGSYRAFSPASWWNTALPADAPLHPRSAQIIDFLRQDNVLEGCVVLAGAGTDTWGTPVYWAATGDPTYAVIATRYRLPPEFSDLRIPRGARPSRNADAEMTVYDRERGYVAWLYGASYDGTTDQWSARGGSIAYLPSNGLHAALAESDDRRNGGTQRGLNGAVVAARYDEVRHGGIEHVLRIGVRSASPEHVFPMIDSDGTSAHPDAPPQGTRIRIRPSVDIDRFALHPEARVIARALQQYGAIVGDTTGAPVELKLEDTVSEGRGQLWAIGKYDLCAVPLDAFEVIAPGYRPPASDDAAAEVPTGVPVDRLSGRDRVHTAINVSKARWESSAAVVLARADDPADALAGASLAGSVGAPLLVTPGDRLHGAVEQEVRRLRASKAFVLGGTRAIGQRVIDDLQRAGVRHVERVAGATRFATAAAVARTLNVPDGSTAVLARATRGTSADQAWVDALSASGLIARKASLRTPWPLLLTGADVPDATWDAIESMGIADIVIIGDARAVPTDTEEELRARGHPTRRIGAADRYARSRAVADLEVDRVRGPLIVATGQDFPDGLAAGALAARMGGTLLLVPATAPPADHLAWIREHRGRFNALTVVGGPKAVSDATVDAVHRALEGR